LIRLASAVFYFVLLISCGASPKVSSDCDKFDSLGAIQKSVFECKGIPDSIFKIKDDRGLDFEYYFFGKKAPFQLIVYDVAAQKVCSVGIENVISAPAKNKYHCYECIDKEGVDTCL
jgi:hypothetical protein